MKLGLSAAMTACLLLSAAPALAQESETSTTTTTVPETETTLPGTDANTTTTSTTTPAPAPELQATNELGPVGAGPATPVRGTQFQLTPPPPPPPTPPPPPPPPLVPWFFQYPANSGSGRRVVYSKSKQSVWVFDANNRVIKMHRVSGKQAPYDPRPGVYRVWSRSRHTYSINNPSITWGYMVRFAHGSDGGNIGFHEIPYQYGRPVQSIGQLGQALSAGCVRQAVSDAVWMWNWAGIGTVVVVTP